MSQWPREFHFTPWQRFWFALGAWFLLFLPAVWIALIALFVLSWVHR